MSAHRNEKSTFVPFFLNIREYNTEYDTFRRTTPYRVGVTIETWGGFKVPMGDSDAGAKTTPKVSFGETKLQLIDIFRRFGNYSRCTILLPPIVLFFPHCTNLLLIYTSGVCWARVCLCSTELIVIVDSPQKAYVIVIITLLNFR